MNNSLLIIGRPDSGKTTFLAQFLTRVRKKMSSIKLSKIPENIKVISDAQKKLSAGDEPGTTAADSNEELVLALIINGNEVELSCPDYGGEQVKSLIGLMAIEPRWQEYVDSSGNWMLFIRASHISSIYDLTVSAYKDIHGTTSNKISTPELSDQANYIELIQALLYAKKIGVKNKIRNPKLSIVITCWDELETNKAPAILIKEIMPLFIQFLESNWDSEKLEVYGLSSQEFSLKNNPEGKDKYLDELPENIGYLVLPDGTQDKDITKLVERAL